jgi:hypothetical protein
MAIAAEAPQIATEPPDIKPCDDDLPNRRAKNNPTAMVPTIAVITTIAVGHPKSVTCEKVIRAPKSATPHRNNVFAQKSTPLFMFVLEIKK